MTPGIATTQTPRRSFQIDSKYIAPILISCILLAGHLTTGILADWTKTAVCILVSILVEAGMGYGVWLHGEAARAAPVPFTAGELAAAIPAAFRACL